MTWWEWLLMIWLPLAVAAALVIGRGIRLADKKTEAQRLVERLDA